MVNRPWAGSRNGTLSTAIRAAGASGRVPERTVRSVVTGNCGATEVRPDVAGKLPTVTVCL